MNKLKILFCLLVFSQILYAQNNNTIGYIVTLEENSNSRMNLTIKNHNLSLIIAEYPHGCVLVDYKIESLDSTSVIVQFDELYTYSKMRNENGKWIQVASKGWVSPSKDKYTRKTSADRITYKLQDYNTVSKIDRDKKVPLRFPD